MTTIEKIKLITDAAEAIYALGRILDGGHHEVEHTEPLCTMCTDAMTALTMLKLRLVEEVGTDNLPEHPWGCFEGCTCRECLALRQ